MNLRMTFLLRWELHDVSPVMTRCVGLERAEVVRRVGEAAVGGTARTLDEAVPRVLALPDLDDANAFVRASRGVEDQPLGPERSKSAAAKRS